MKMRMVLGMRLGKVHVVSSSKPEQALNGLVVDHKTNIVCMNQLRLSMNDLKCEHISYPDDD